MLSQELEDNCHKLNVAYRKYEKNRKKAAISGIILLAIVVVIFALIPEGQTVYDRPEISYPGAIGILILTITLGYFQNKANKTKKTGHEKYLVKLYRAYDHLQHYKKDEDQDRLDSASDDLDSVVTDLKIDWSDLPESNTSFKSLKMPISNFINNLDLRLVPALDAEKINMMRINDALEKIIEFFDNDDFSQINKVNDELVKNFDEQSEEEKSFLEKIRENRNLTKILISILIITATGGISFGAKLGVSADNVTFVGWWIVLSSAFVVAYLWKAK